MPSKASAWGLEVTSNSADAASLYDAAVSDYVSQSGDAVGKCMSSVDRDSGMVASLALEGLLRCFRFDFGERVPLLRARAQKLVEMGHCTHRERALVGALTSWSEGRWREAVAILEGWLLEQPVDVLVVRLAHDMYHLLGDATQLRDSPGRVLGAWETGMPGYFFVCGMLSYGAAECGQYGLAEEQGMRVLSEEMRDVWALHAVCHAHEAMGRRYEGQRLLRTARWWWDEATMLTSHLHWHWALFQMEDGQFEKAAFRYDAWIREGGSSGPSDIADAATLLWRMELLGNPVYDRWRELLPHVLKTPVGTSIFNDVATTLVLAAAEEDQALENHLQAMRNEAFSKPVYSPAHTTTIKTPTNQDCRTHDTRWFAGLSPYFEEEEGERSFFEGGRHRKKNTDFEGEHHQKATDFEGEHRQKATDFEGEHRQKATDFEGEHHQKATDFEESKHPKTTSSTDVAISSSSSVAHWTGDRVRVGLDPPGMENVSEDDLVVVARPDLTFGPEREEDEEGDVVLGGAGGHDGKRPILCAPFSTLPVLPLVMDEEEEDVESDLVSIGGVGGLGLGSHSIVDQRYLLGVVGVPLAEGMAAYRRGDFEGAVARLLPIRSILSHVGCSASQRDVFHLTLEAAATQSRQVLLARALLRERLTRHPNAGMANFHLSSVLYATGEHRLAGQARDRALRMGLGEGRKAAVKVLGHIGAMQRPSDDWDGKRATPLPNRRNP